VEFSYTTTTSKADWERWTTQNIGTGDTGICLETATAVREAKLSDHVVDHAVSPTGILYTIHPSGALYQYDPTADLYQRLLDSAESSLKTPSAICASENRVFVADGADGTIVTVSPRVQQAVGTLESSVPDPLRLTYSNGKLYTLDGNGQITSTDGDEEDALTFEWFLRNPTDISIDNGLSTVLDRVDDEPVIRQFETDEEIHDEQFPITTAQFTTEEKRFIPTALTTTANTVVVAGTLEDGSEHGLFEWDPTIQRFEQRYTFDAVCTEIIGMSTGNDGKRVFYALVGENRTCHVLRETTEYARDIHRNQHVGMAFYRYDSGARDTDWHRLALELGRTSASTQVRLRYYGTDEPAVFPFSPENILVDGLEPKTIERLQAIGIDTIWDLATCDPDSLAQKSDDVGLKTTRAWKDAACATLSTQVEANWTTVETIDPTDTLLERATGRYLFVAIELIGSPTASPLVESVTAFCPRQSYLRYLPEVYQEDEQSAAFLERFLSVFETSFANVESEIEQITRYFDPYGVPSESLPWLEDWLAIEAYREWPESARRELLARAPELYKKRGTRGGLRDILELYLRHTTEPAATKRGTLSTRTRPTTADGFDASGTHTMTATADGGEDGDLPTGHRLFFLEPRDLDIIDDEQTRLAYASMLPNDRSFVLYCGPLESDDQREAIEAIIQNEKPAHVTGTLAAMEGGFGLGGETFLGINSTLTTRQFAMGAAVLGEDTVLRSR